MNDLPTNNIISKRNLYRCDREARVAKHRNQRFMVKNICNNMVQQQYGATARIKLIWRLIKCPGSCPVMLSNCETSWNIGHQEKVKERLQEKLKKECKGKRIHKKTSSNCKSWDGLCTSVEELYEIIQEKPYQQVQIVTNELTYFAHTHKTDNCQTTFTPTKWDFSCREIDEFCPFARRWWTQLVTYKWWSCKCI